MLAWIGRHVGEHGGDPSRVVLAGSSAGAHLTSFTALRRSRHGATPDAVRIRAVVALYGYFGRYYGLGAPGDPVSSPLEVVHPGAPPFLVVHGDHDTYVPAEAARRFADRLASTSRAQVVYAELPGAQHGFDLFRSPRYDSVVDAVQTFLGPLVPASPGRAAVD
jgi:acetyl esterase/lipase